MKKRYHILIVVVVILLSSYIEVVFGNDLGTFLANTMMFLYFFYYLMWLRDRLNNTTINENLEFVKYRPKMSYSLFTWLGEEKSSDRIIYELIGDIFEKPKTLDTLKELKKVIDTKISGELIDYYLVREAIKKSRKHSFGEFFKFTIRLILGTAGVAFISALVNAISKSKMENLWGGQNSFSIMNYLYLIMLPLFFLILLSIIYTVWSKSNRRANMVIMILDELIKEKEIIRDSNKLENSNL